MFALVILGAILLSVILKFVIYFFLAEDFDPESPYTSATNMVLIMLVTTIIPFALGYAVCLYHVG